MGELGDFFRPRFDLACRIIANLFVEVDELMSVVCWEIGPRKSALRL
jgi:hypothetical protein